LRLIKPPIPKLGYRTVQLPPKERELIYGTPDHVEWSYAIRKRAGWQCERCGKRTGRMFADHIIELKDGGNPHDLSNGQCLCGSCHTLKTNNHRALRYGDVHGSDDR
jgi:5-methylcytosine-specific restriction endonuclease McrA